MYVSIFGQLRIQNDLGTDINVAKIKSKKARDILLYLILFHRRRIPVDLLCEIFWPGMEKDYARANLQTTISLIRQHLGKDVITYCDGTYCFDRVGQAAVDAEQFEISVMKARTCRSEEEKMKILNQTMEQYTDDVVPECCYEEWVIQAREHYKDLLIEALLELIGFEERAEEFTKVRDLSKRMLEKDPFNELACLSYVRALCNLGQETEALCFYDSFSTRMEKELGVLPSPELRDFHDTLLACRKRKMWIITVETENASEKTQILKNVLRQNDEIRILSEEKINLFVRDVDEEVAESIRRRIEEALKEQTARVKTYLRKAR